MKPLLSMMSPAGARGRLSVFIFHRVLPQHDPIFSSEVDVIQFDKIMGWIKNWFNVLPLDVAVNRLKSKTLPARAAAITFDDGYADNYSQALPILQRHGLKATFFIATGFLNGGRMWNDIVIEAIRGCQLPELNISALDLGIHPICNVDAKRAAINSVIQQIKYLPVEQRTVLAEELAEIARATIPDNLMMTSSQVLELHRTGMQIGAHTVSHPILARLTDEQARREIHESRDFLEQLLGQRVGLFAYPNGKPGEDYTQQTVDVVRSLGFDAAVSTRWGANGPGGDFLQIRRFTPWDRTKLRFGARILGNLRSS